MRKQMIVLGWLALAAACGAKPDAPSLTVADVAVQTADIATTYDDAANDDGVADAALADVPVKADDAASDTGSVKFDAKTDVKPVGCAGAPLCLATDKPGCAATGEPCSAAVHVVDGTGQSLDGATTALIVALGSVPIGGIVDLEVRIANNGGDTTAAALHIASVSFDYQPVGSSENAATGKLALACWDSGMEKPCGQATLLDMVPDYFTPKSDQTWTELVRIRFTHLDEQPRQGLLHLKFTGDPAWEGKDFVVPVKTASGVAKLIVPSQIVFAAGVAATQPLAIQNGGGGVLQLKSAGMKGNQAFQVQITGSDVPFDTTVSYAPLSIAAGQKVTAQVVYSGAGAGQATLELVTNDPAGATSQVQLLAK